MPRKKTCTFCSGDGFTIVWKNRGLIKVLDRKEKCENCDGQGFILVYR